MALPLLFASLLFACGDPSGIEEGEWLPGGETTNTLLLGANAFLRPAANLSDEDETAFYSGNSFFNQAWVEAPASTENRDGLGPVFNARSCSGCHFRDGKGLMVEDGQGPLVGLLIRLSVPGEHGPIPDPVYGSQLQDQALPDVPVEAIPRIELTEITGSFADGTPYTLLSPTYTLEQPGYGPLPDDLMISPRLAPHMIGLGLLDAIPESRLHELADPDDSDGDGISGRVQILDDGRVGRFGWKADSPNVAEQSAAAFAGDLGLTSSLQLTDDCTSEQPECTEHPNGGDPEVEDKLLDRTILYSQAVAPPVRRNAEDPTVLEGKALFGVLGCDGCHTPSHTTGDDYDLDAMEGQLIWPYTDLLLHDMGPGLADDRPLASADGQEWKTPPLWGLGLVDEVAGEPGHFLHDGRARSLEEAILWHGGEAETAQESYLELSETERHALLTFLEDL